MTLALETLSIDGPLLVKPQRFVDNRGYFSEVFSSKEFQVTPNLPLEFVQINESVSGFNVLRGLHFQTAPMGQGKLIRVLHGKIFDVAVNIDKGSEDFGKHASLYLDSESGHWLWLPQNFAHGFLSLTENTKIEYLVTMPYSKEHDTGVRWDDPMLKISWPGDGDYVISEKDKLLKPLSEL